MDNSAWKRELPAWKWRAYLHARQLYIETGDADALANMLANVSESDGEIPEQVGELVWQTATGPAPVTIPVEYLRCY